MKLPKRLSRNAIYRCIDYYFNTAILLFGGAGILGDCIWWLWMKYMEWNPGTNGWFDEFSRTDLEKIAEQLTCDIYDLTRPLKSPEQIINDAYAKHWTRRN